MTTEPLAAGLQERLSDHRFRSGAYLGLIAACLVLPLTAIGLDLLARRSASPAPELGKKDSLQGS
jgi:hypothetical protein